MAQLYSPQETPNRLKMIRQALKDKAPQTYAALKSEGTLHQFLTDHDEQMMASFWDSEIAAVQQLPKPETYQDNLQNQTQARARAWEETLAVYLDFADPIPGEAQTMSSPPAA